MFDLAPRGHDENTIPTEWVGALSNASSVSDLSTSHFGQNVMVATGPAPQISWSFMSEGGARELWATYAAWESRPVCIYVNDRLIASNALWEMTGGWTEQEQTSTFQTLVTLLPGENKIQIVGFSGFPHLRNISICHPTTQKVPVDQRFSHAKVFSNENKEGRIDLRSRDFNSLNMFVSQMKKSGLTDEKIEEVFFEYTKARTKIQGNINILNGFGGPFNGERLRLRITNDIMDAVNFSAFIETGAYVGTTTEHFARTGMPVLSCEAVLSNFVVATQRLSRYDNVDLQLADSRFFLKKTLAEYPQYYRCPLFYLDAHWFDDLPLSDELNFISGNVDNYVAIVDDFEVPNSKYFYDRYSNGNELTFSYLVPKLERLGSMVLLVPSNASTEETGPRKGTLFVCPKKLYEERLFHITRLQIVDPTPWLS